MEHAIDRLRADIQHFLAELKTKRLVYEESMQKDEVLANTRLILQEIKRLEKSIITVVEEHLKNDKANI